MKYITSIEGREFEIEILDEHQILLNGKPYFVDFESVGGQPIYSLLIDGRSFETHVYPGEENYQVFVHGNFYPVLVEDEREKRLRSTSGIKAAEASEIQIRAPMPGLVVTVPVEEGQAVGKGEVLVILESMKMQNELKAPRAGNVSRIRIKPGDSVEQKQTLLTIT